MDWNKLADPDRDLEAVNGRYLTVGPVNVPFDEGRICPIIKRGSLENLVGRDLKIYDDQKRLYGYFKVSEVIARSSEGWSAFYLRGKINSVGEPHENVLRKAFTVHKRMALMFGASYADFKDNKHLIIDFKNEVYAAREKGIQDKAIKILYEVKFLQIAKDPMQPDIDPLRE